MTLKEAREKARIAETSNLGPGGVLGIPDFMAGMKSKINFGSKYEFKP